MYHALLPPNEKRMLKREYRTRAVSVFLFTLSLAILVGVSSLFPVFIRATMDEQAANSEAVFAGGANNKNEVMDLRGNVVANQKLLASLSQDLDRPEFTDIVAGLVNQRGNIVLTGISITNASAGTFDISLTGSSPTRNALLVFKGRLESDPGVKVDLPVSELAKSANIAFSLRVIKKLP